MKILRKIFPLILCIAFYLAVLNCGISVITAKALIYSVDNLPDYTSVPYVEINSNVPRFDSNYYSYNVFEHYSDLDDLGRCGIAFALVCRETMPTENRGSINSVNPTGWQQNKYDTSLVSGGYIYNRCHLIGWQLTGENANKRNLITGTRYMNIDGMVGFENSVAEYVKENDGHVLYRVTPVFEGENLLASGVLMEAFSVDDTGESISFFIYCFNVQPGITIDYKTGQNEIAIIIIDEDKKRYVYVLNTNTKKYHSPQCRFAQSISDNNRKVVNGIKCCPENEGYTACSVCKANTVSQLLGNTDSDDFITVYDSRMILRYALGLDAITFTDICICDTDSDHNITVSDARSILRIALGL